jgi:transposase
MPDRMTACSPLATRSTRIGAGFLDPESRSDLIELTRDGSVAHRLARRANALLLLDDGMSCEAIAEVLYLDDDTIRTWHRLYREEGIEGLAGFGHEGSACRLSGVQQDKLTAWITETLPRTTREVGAWIETECGIIYESRSGLIALLHRLGMEHRKPKAVSSKLDADKQAAFIKAYENLLNQLGDDEAVLFGDAVHRTIERCSIRVEAGARPRSDNDRKAFVVRNQHMDLRDREAKIVSWPHIVPLRLDPGLQAPKHVPVRAECQDIRMEQRPGERIINCPNMRGKTLKPSDEPRLRFGIGLRQPHIVTLTKVPKPSVATAIRWPVPSRTSSP